jgi:hypothetical protein
MAEVPVKKRTRKTTTKKVERKTPSSSATKATSSAGVRRKGLSLKFILLTILFLFLASGGAFYIGYSAEGAIDVNERLSDDGTRVDGQVSGDSADGIQKPAPLKERPILEPAAVETPAAAPTPEPEVVDEEVDNVSGEEEVSADTIETSSENQVSEEETAEVVDPSSEVPAE